MNVSYEDITEVHEDVGYTAGARPSTIEGLLGGYQKPEGDYSILDFAVPAGLHVYNVSREVTVDGKRIVLGRTERVDNQFSSKVIPFTFEEATGKWRADSNISNLNQLTAGKIMQDPQITHVNGEWAVNCIEVVLDDANNPEAGCHYWTNIYSGQRLDNLALLAQSPQKMKCVRLVELENGQVGVFTRPQSDSPEQGGLGKIGFCVVDNLGDVDATVMKEAPLIHDLFQDHEWGGVNDVRLMPNGKLLALGHIARYLTDSPIKDDREYHTILFEFEPQRRKWDNLRMVSRADDILDRLDFEVKPKEEYLQRVEYANALGSDLDPQSDSIVVTSSVRDRLPIAQKIPNPVLL